MSTDVLLVYDLFVHNTRRLQLFRKSSRGKIDSVLGVENSNDCTLIVMLSDFTIYRLFGTFEFNTPNATARLPTWSQLYRIGRK